MSDTKAVSNEKGFSSLYVFCPRKRTPSSIMSIMMSRNTSPRYKPAIIFSKSCCPGLLDVSSMCRSHFVRGRYSLVSESKLRVACTRKRCFSTLHQLQTQNVRRESATHAPHSQLMAISASSGRLRCLILGMFLTFST